MIIFFKIENGIDSKIKKFHDFRQNISMNLHPIRFLIFMKHRNISIKNAIHRFIMYCISFEARRESNPDQKFRKLLFYPLNYRALMKGKSNVFLSISQTFDGYPIVVFSML